VSDFVDIVLVSINIVGNGVAILQGVLIVIILVVVVLIHVVRSCLCIHVALF
jgi:hypothetical protein